MENNPTDLVARRLCFARAILAKEATMAALCRAFQISRPTGYAWLQKFEESGKAGLVDGRSTSPGRPLSQARAGWAEEVLALRRRKPRWGAKKLYASLRRAHPRAKLPSVRVIARLLRSEGQIGVRRARTVAGPKMPKPAQVVADRPNRVWTMDFKGWFRTGDGRRCDPLTVRDLYSRCVLWIEHVPAQSDLAVRAVLERCFRRHGLPQVVRVDNGSPFGGVGALGLSRLSVWWIRLGIQVEFTRPACPQDNGAHEQLHRELKAATARPPAASLQEQARRFARFQREYNHERPHEALALRCPGERYRQSRRPYRKVAPLRYAKGAQVRKVKPGGRIRWEGRTRLIGGAFANEIVWLKPAREREPAAPRGQHPAGTVPVWEIYLGALLIGELHQGDPGGMRGVRWLRSGELPRENSGAVMVLRSRATAA